MCVRGAGEGEYHHPCIWWGRGESFFFVATPHSLWALIFKKAQDVRYKVTDTPKLEIVTWIKQEVLGPLVAASLESRRIFLPPLHQ